MTLESEASLLVGLCPFHDDHHPSLKIDPKEQRFRCWASKCGAHGDCFDWVSRRDGVDFKEALKRLAAKANMLPEAGTKPTNSKPRYFPWESADQIYNYTDEHGKLLYQVGRVDPPKFNLKGKWFSQRAPKVDQPKGFQDWAYTLSNIRRVLYRLPELQIAAAFGKTIYLVEGEKSADVLNDHAKTHGLPIFATTNVMGAGKWDTAYTDALSGCEVVIVRDRDEAGIAHANKIYAELVKVTKSVQIVESSSKDASKKPLEKHDINEHLAEGLSLDELTPVDAPAGDAATLLLIDNTKKTGGDEPEKLELTELGNAGRLLRHHDNLRYISEFKAWFVWNGNQWMEDKRGTVIELAKRTVRAIHIEAFEEADDDKRAKIGAHALKSQKDNAIRAMVRLAETSPRAALGPEELDQHHWVFNCANGMIDLTNGALLPHDPLRYCTRFAPFPIDKNAKCERWLQFLAEIMGNDQDLISYLQRVAGYCLTGSIREQTYFLLHGSGRNGKSTFINVLSHVFGNYAVAADMETFLIDKRGPKTGPRSDVARLAGARLVSAIEVPKGRSLDNRILKSLTGSDTITVRDLYKKEFEYKPQCKLLFGLNDLPNLDGHDEATWRRVHRIPFGVTIEPWRVDSELEAKLLAEAPGILNWALRGCIDWQTTKLCPPKIVTQAKEEYRAEMDPLGDYLEAFCTPDRLGIVAVTDLRVGYNEWAKENGLREMEETAFGRAMNNRSGVEKRKYGPRRKVHFFGIRFLNPAEMDARDTKERDSERVRTDLPQTFPLYHPRETTLGDSHPQPSHPLQTGPTDLLSDLESDDFDEVVVNDVDYDPMTDSME